MAGRPPKQKPDEIQDKSNLFDKYLIDVNREVSGRWNVTKSITIAKLERPNMGAAQITVDALNASQDWQNASTDGIPKIIWYFLAGTVKVGEEYKANDVQKSIEDEETGDVIKLFKHDGSPDLLGLNITDRKIKEWIPGKQGNLRGKPVYADTKIAEPVED